MTGTKKDTLAPFGISCPLCGSPSSASLPKPVPRDNYNNVFVPGWICVCGSCDLRFSHPLPQERDIRKYFSDLYLDIHRPSNKSYPFELRHDTVIGRVVYRFLKAVYLRARVGIDRVRWAQARRSRQVSLVADVLSIGDRGVSVLDIGCASYNFLAAARLMGWQVMGLEPHRPTVEQLQGWGARVLLGSIEDVNVPGQYDAVTFWHVLGHVISPETSLRKARALTRKGGYIFIDTPNVRYSDYFLVNNVSYSFWGFSQSAMVNLFKRVGYVLTEVYHSDFSNGRKEFVRCTGKEIPGDAHHVVFVGQAVDEG